jgi:hypothetical protein
MGYRLVERGGRRCGNNHGATNAGTRPQSALPIFSALAPACVENSAITDLVSATRAAAFTSLIADATQSYTIFRRARFGRVLAL